MIPIPYHFYHISYHYYYPYIQLYKHYIPSKHQGNQPHEATSHQKILATLLLYWTYLMTYKTKHMYKQLIIDKNMNLIIDNTWTIFIIHQTYIMNRYINYI
eukprot:51711_1